jgi:hypothetical protein
MLHIDRRELDTTKSATLPFSYRSIGRERNIDHHPAHYYFKNPNFPIFHRHAFPVPEQTTF